MSIKINDKKTVFAIFLVLIIILSPIVVMQLYAQSQENGKVTVTVKDQNSDPIGSAIVQAIINGSEVSSGMTGSDGSFRFDNLVPEEYIFRANKDGFGSNTEYREIKSGENPSIVLWINLPTPTPTVTPTPTPTPSPVITPIASPSSTPTPAPTTTPAPTISPSKPPSYIPPPVTQYTASSGKYPRAVLNSSWLRVGKNEIAVLDGSASYDPDGAIFKYLWDFGDGETAEGAVVEHAYSHAGEYFAKLTVVDNSNLRSSATRKVIVSTEKPVPVPGDRQIVTVGEKAVFDGSESFDSDGSIVKYEWSFGDGAYAEGVVVEHVFDRIDTYKVSLKVTDDDDISDTRWTVVEVVAEEKDQKDAAGNDKDANSKFILFTGAGVVLGIVGLFLLVRRKDK